MKFTFPHNHFTVFLILIVLGFPIYSNILHGEFVSDDYGHIVGNFAVRDFRNLEDLWYLFNTRLLVGFSFALNYAIGEFNVFGYHLVNILIHILATFLVYQLALLTLQTPFLVPRYTLRESRSLALVASLIFLCHPIQTQSVSFITQRFVLMATLFYLTTIIFYVKARLESRRDYYCMAFVTMLLGMLSKEMTITIPFMLLMYEIFFFSNEKIFSSKKLKRITPYFLIVILLPCILFQDRLGSNLGLKYQLITRSFNGNYFLTELSVLCTYLRLLFLPVNQNFDYDYPIVQRLWEPHTLFSIVFLASLWWLAIKLFSRDRLVSFCIFWFFLTTSVEVVVVSFVNKGVIYEHWLYLPMVGFSLFLTLMIRRVSHNDAVYRIFFVVVVFFYCFLTYQRNFVWQNEIRFWQDVVSKSPNKAGPHWGLGIAYSRKGDDALAMASYKRAVQVESNLSEGYNNLGVIYMRYNDNQSAQEYFERAITIDPQNGPAYNNLAFFHFLNADYSKALTYYVQSLQRQGEYPQAYYYMAQCYRELGQLVQAKEYFNKAIRLYEERNNPEGAKEAKQLLEALR